MSALVELPIGPISDLIHEARYRPGPMTRAERTLEIILMVRGGRPGGLQIGRATLKKMVGGVFEEGRPFTTLETFLYGLSQGHPEGG